MNSVDTTKGASFESLGLTKEKPKLQEKKLGQEDFLALMSAQMKNQDPMKPMENGEFISQMAQFSAATGMKEIKDAFTSLATSLQSNQALQASSMVGRKVLVPGNRSELPQQGEMVGAVDVPFSTSELKVMITDSHGQLVKTLDLGARQQGTAQFKWDGMVDGPEGAERASEGRYRISAQIMADGKPQNIDTLITDSVQSVSLGKPGEGVTLNLAGSGTTSLAKIKEIM